MKKTLLLLLLNPPMFEGNKDKIPKCDRDECLNLETSLHDDCVVNDWKITKLKVAIKFTYHFDEKKNKEQKNNCNGLL